MLNLRPQETVSETDLQTGLRMLMFDGVCTQIMGTLAGGAFLVAYALILGASNYKNWLLKTLIICFMVFGTSPWVGRN